MDVVAELKIDNTYCVVQGILTNQSYHNLSKLSNATLVVCSKLRIIPVVVQLPVSVA